METSQTKQEQQNKSKQLTPTLNFNESAAETHGALRHSAGFDLMQLFAEFRALHASVLFFWSRSDASRSPGREIRRSDSV